MRQRHYTVTSAAVTQETLALLDRALPGPDWGHTLSHRALLWLLVLMAAWRRSLTALCRTLDATPSHETVRQALHAHLVPLPDVATRLATVLQTHGPWHTRLGRRKGWYLACDLHHQPFYGQTTSGVCGGPAKAGTKRFWTYATVAVVQHGQRWTLALVPVRDGDLAAVLADLWAQLRPLQLRVKCLLLDRGFYAAPVLAWLQQQKVPHLLPAIRRGRPATDPRGASGTATFFAARQEGTARYTWDYRGKKKTKLTVTVRLALVRVLAGRQRPRRRRTWVFVYHGLTVGRVRGLRTLYRRRFGIESSYRQLRQSLARTSSTDARVRLLLVGVALLLRNVWVWLHWEVFAVPRRGRRLVRLDQLRLDHLLAWLTAELLRYWGGLCTALTTQRAMNLTVRAVTSV